MGTEWGTGWSVHTAIVPIEIAWVVTGLYFLASALLTNRIKRREPIRRRLLDTALLWGGYFLLFSGAPVPGLANQHFLTPRVSLETAGVVCTYL